MDPMIEQAALQAAGTGLGMITAKWNDRRQLEQQQKLQEQEMAGAQKMARFNQGMALDMWEKTNYSAQRAQMEKAGLNVGLMYGSAGQGGSTQTPGGSVTGGHAPAGGGELGMGLQLGLQMQLQKAQIENIQADTQQKKTDTIKTAGVDTELTKSQTGKLIAEAKIAELQIAYQAFQNTIASLEANRATFTFESTLEQIKGAADKVVAEAESAQHDARIKRESADSIIDLHKQEALEAAVRITAINKGLVKTDAEIKAINAGISQTIQKTRQIVTERQQSWDKLNLQEREVIVKEAMQELQGKQTEFNTSTPQEIKQWVDVITGALGALWKPTSRSESKATW